MTVCNMNTLRRSLVLTLIEDPDLSELDVTYPELKKIIHLVFIDGEDHELDERDKLIVESKLSRTLSSAFKC